MAILSKIRDRSLALIAVIGLALFAFVLDPSTLTDFFDSAKINEVGEVDGETISRQDYAEALDSYNARTNGRVTEMQAGNVVWDKLLKNKIYSNQLARVSQCGALSVTVYTDTRKQPFFIFIFKNQVKNNKK